MKDLKEIRQELDEIDKNIAELLEKRLELIEEVAEYKRLNKTPVLDKAREAEKLEAVARLVNNSEYCEYVKSSFESIMAESRALQMKRIAGPKNIYLIGMPGCGKSTIGKILAERMGYEFCDLDELITKKNGMSPGEIITERGEAAFRAVETGALEQMSCEGGYVVATGGGVVTREENHRLLRTNSIVVYIRRELSELATEGRPISKMRNLKDIYEERRENYESWSDITEDNNSAGDCAERIYVRITSEFTL